jgi:hypothetical protein
VQVDRSRTAQVKDAAEAVTHDGERRAFIDERGEVRLRCATC